MIRSFVENTVITETIFIPVLNGTEITANEPVLFKMCDCKANM